MRHLRNIVDALATSKSWKSFCTFILIGATRSLRLVVLEVAKAEAADAKAATAPHMLSRDRTAATLAAENLPTDSAVMSSPQGCEFAGTVVALDRDVIRHPVLPALLCFPTRGEKGGKLVQHQLGAARLHTTHNP